ncbi:MAG: S1-like domain-containing RNA-binding protein [Spirochaetia bacterium]|nr:S1-like domain-containing RNA-binding protein [Spirochaetia bacterium]
MRWDEEISENKIPELKVGDFNTLEVVRFVDFGAYLESRDCDILLPKSKIPDGTKIGEMLGVFIYKDSENRLIATTDQPKITINQCAFLQVMDVTKYGAFLDWGIENQLLVPYREQTMPMKAGLKYLVYLYLDKVSDRLVATMRIEKHLSKVPRDLTIKEKVHLYIYQKTPIGYKAVINQKYAGMLYDNELGREVHIGDLVTGYVKAIRDDHKIDLSLQPIGFDRLNGITEIILNELLKHNGFLPLNDKSPPEKVKKQFNISKSDFKKAVGILFKQKKIELRENGIALSG